MSLLDGYAMRDEAREEAYRRNGICTSNDPECSCPVCHDDHVANCEVEDNAKDNPLEYVCCVEAMRNIGLILVFALFTGCAGAKHYVPEPTPYDPCENVQFPNRLPTDMELDIIKNLRKDGQCEDLRTYLETIR